MARYTMKVNPNMYMARLDVEFQVRARAAIEYRSSPPGTAKTRSATNALRIARAQKGRNGGDGPTGIQSYAYGSDSERTIFFLVLGSRNSFIDRSRTDSVDVAKKKMS